MIKMKRRDLRRFVNALFGRHHLELDSNVDQEQIIFPKLRELHKRGATGKLINYRWVPESKRSIRVTPERAEKLLKDKMATEIKEGRAVGFGMDYGVYFGKYGGRKHIIEVY